ncbi:MAG: cardiolipin synthase [Blautia sp.]|nr:cardiolipin synthase [Blautia sp.]
MNVTNSPDIQVSQRPAAKERKNIILKSLSKLLKLLFNRIFYVAFAILAQIGWLALLAFYFVSYSSYIYIGVEVLAIILVLWIVNKKMNPSYKLAWTVTILAVPVFGVLLYFLFGKSRIAAAMAVRIEKVTDDSRPFLLEDQETRRQLMEADPSVNLQSLYIRDKAGFPLCGHTETQYFQVGDQMFPVLVSELQRAERFIFIEYFIINDGLMWETILGILEKKAAEGVDVRLIYDGFGGLTSLPARYAEKLREKNLKCVVFNPFRPILNIVQNNRDHRKLCIIDGKTGFTGGINLSDEYINQKKRFGHWKDTAVMLRGDAVWNMTVMFLHMWQVVNKDDTVPDYQAYMPETDQKHPFVHDGFVQPFSDSPLDKETVGENVYLHIINRANRYVYICTPYLIIDNEMMTALCLAAKSGVDVRIITPSVPDKRMVFWLSQSYYEQLLEAGVKIYEYQPGFLHAKSFVCDDEIGVVGTINLDYRSLYLHFEDGVWMYKTSVIGKMRTDFENTLAYSKPVTLEFCHGRNIFVRLVQNVLRLVAPMI